MYKICFYAPESHVEQVKEALFENGAGKIGDYSCCAWQTLGEGQFMPLAGSDAYIGEKNQIARIPEYKVEMVCNEEKIKQAITALKNAHPYEEPAYQVIKLEEF